MWSWSTAEPQVVGKQILFVTTGGYRKDALELAEEAGVRPLVLEGLSADRLKLAVGEAVQSFVFLLARWDILQRFSDHDFSEELPAPFITFDYPAELGDSTHRIITFLYLLWKQDKIPSEVGKHRLAFRMPSSFEFSKGEGPKQNSLVFLTYEVTAHVAASPGSSSIALLRNAATDEVEKIRIGATFEKLQGRVELSEFKAEDQLRAFLGEVDASLVTRVKVPRVKGQMCYWPPSKRAAEEIRRRREAGEEPTFKEIETGGLEAAWDASIYDEENE